ncbi:procathepsin L [Halyomorpha halys]|uniref:procathepsin L n=1 Tax=Halyomorpha halys TaxID=286706 RepID=UPI0006D4E672|nr:cathepsin L1-like isoform X1 [Halyomorpha halys]XP_014273554.1 cathepsin L1-like [Halyomorpha halys]KAE8573144.1 Cat10 [Halyomorpha halys]
MKLTFVLCFTLTLALSALSLPFDQSEDEEWNAYKIKYGKSYATKEEDQLRKNIYFDNKHRIAKHNDLHANGIKTYKLGVNKFADMTATEFSKFMKGYKGEKKQAGELYVPPANENLPSSVDWRQKGAVTGIKNQGQCGSCWAFSSTGSIEGQHFLKTGKLVSLSEQNLMDCSTSEGNESCNGGLMDYAFEYVKKNNGIDTEASYPYKGEDSSTCKYKKANIGATITGYKDVQSGSESALQSAVANVGPISVAIDASSFDFQLYDSGIYYEEDCSSSELDHGVLAVGYGSENGKDYWLVKNSWGEDWGISGYIKMIRNKNNNCGIATQASYPLV